MKTFREIAEMHYPTIPNNDIDKQYRENRIKALEKLLTEQLRQSNVVGRSKQCFCSKNLHNEKHDCLAGCYYADKDK